ncbi:HesA/MoeB/ThiF family protein [Hyphomicrobium zavarzinii]|uniref:HesA/MoeB/ThiF family protein n=1 Tax=Hyphomicrobium zavarzinii TaxID=48292 RepID=UPI0018DECECA|nr:HesA/MoeB/ThiF family protein [Hyphomicrobium zavarzinii]
MSHIKNRWKSFLMLTVCNFCNRTSMTMSSLMPHTSAETTRESRHALLSGVGNKGISEMKAARIVLIGCGGVGQAVAAMLGASGIGALTLVDADKISATNLGRLPLMQPSDIGRSKADALKEALLRNNPNLTVDCMTRAITSSLLPSPIANTDLIIDATDNWPTRKLLAQHCRAARLPLVSGGALAAEGWVGTFLPHSPPLESWLGQPRQTADSCEHVGVLAPLVAAIGSLMAMEALKVLWQRSSPAQWATLSGRILYFDGRYGDVRVQSLG